MRRIISATVMLCLACLSLTAQTNSTIEKMRSERQQLEKQIASQEKILTSTEKNITAELSNLKIVTAKLNERTRLLKKTKDEIKGLDSQITKLNRDISQLQKEYDKCTDNYAQACVFYQRQSSQMNVLMFVLASDSFRQMTRRVRYVNEYSSSLDRLARQIEGKKDTLQTRKSQLETLRKEKRSLEQRQSENEKASKQEQIRQQSAVDGLQKKRSQLKKEITAQQKKMDALSKEIDRQIQLAIKEEQNHTKGKMSEQDLKLSGSFESNKGKLPIPITGAWLIVGEYGISNVAGMKDVKQNNLGIDIQGEKGAQAMCVFEGTVSQIFQQSKGQYGVLVRHGKYISVYCNIASTALKKGDNLKIGDRIGLVQTSENGSPVLHFQLHRESTRLNPSDWLRK